MRAMGTELKPRPNWLLWLLDVLPPWEETCAYRRNATASQPPQLHMTAEDPEVLCCEKWCYHAAKMTPLLPTQHALGQRLCLNRKALVIWPERHHKKVEKAVWETKRQSQKKKRKEKRKIITAVRTSTETSIFFNVKRMLELSVSKINNKIGQIAWNKSFLEFPVTSPTTKAPPCFKLQPGVYPLVGCLV